MPALGNSRLFYQNGRITTELGGSTPRSVFQHKGGLLAQSTLGFGASASIMVVDSGNTVMAELNHVAKAQFPYTPYGGRPAQSELNNPFAFNGERLSSVANCYLLCYRAFSYARMRFGSPDNLSPFGKGGLNAYMYCAGDPINYVDPTGRNRFTRYFTPQNAVRAVAASPILIGSGMVLGGAYTMNHTLTNAGFITMLGGSGTFWGQEIIYSRVTNRIANFFEARATRAEARRQLPPRYKKALRLPKPNHSRSNSIDSELPPYESIELQTLSNSQPSVPPPAYETHDFDRSSSHLVGVHRPLIASDKITVVDETVKDIRT